MNGIVECEEDWIKYFKGCAKQFKRLVIQSTSLLPKLPQHNNIHPNYSLIKQKAHFNNSIMRLYN